MIVGTAGHIDHGKTTLVHALTGVDTDRLPEEKRRGISIELGYAYLPRPDGGGTIGFVDVPGHERLLHTMLAGATGIDHLLLLVAADDGVMPQTREHLAVAVLLGLHDATVALTKTDRATPARVAAVRAEVEALLAPTPLAAAPVFEVAATRGDGVDALRLRLFELAAQPPRAADPHAGFRLAVDRAFTLAGAGTVATGSVHAGRVAVGDTLCIVPGPQAARVRSLHAQNRPAGHAGPGERCAVALAGLPREAVGRGQWLCAPDLALQTDRLDVRLRLWPGEAAALKGGTPVHLHLGTADVTGSVALLDADVLAPGGEALAQLVLSAPVAAWHGDRGVLRDAGASRTIAGVQVLDPLAPVRYRRTPARLAWLRAASLDAPAARVAALIEAAPDGLDLPRTARTMGWRADAMPLPADAVRLPQAAVGAAAFARLQAALLAALEAVHAAQPDEIGPDLQRLKRLAAPRTLDAVWRHAVDTLVADGRLVRSGAWLHLPSHGVRLGEAEQRLAERLRPAMADGGFDPPWVRDLAAAAGAPEPAVRQTLARLAQRGEVFAVVKDLYYPAATLRRLAALAREAADGPQGLAAASFRDATGLGRKRAIQILEFFDRVGLTRRVRDTHRLRDGAETLFDG